MITDAEIDAGARALAARFFINGAIWPFSKFQPSHQQEFRDKARAVLEAAELIRGHD